VNPSKVFSQEQRRQLVETDGGPISREGQWRV
jgi:hypothetical protein